MLEDMGSKLQKQHNIEEFSHVALPVQVNKMFSYTYISEFQRIGQVLFSQCLMILITLSVVRILSVVSMEVLLPRKMADINNA